MGDVVEEDSIQVILGYCDWKERNERRENPVQLKYERFEMKKEQDTGFPRIRTEEEERRQSLYGKGDVKVS